MVHENIIIPVSLDQLKGLLHTVVQEELSKQSIPSASAEDVSLTRKEVSLLIKKSLVTVHNWTEKGILKKYKGDRGVFYKKNEVLASLTKSN